MVAGEGASAGSRQFRQNTFLPHTHRKASVLFLRRRLKGEKSNDREDIFFAVSEKAGKDSKGKFLLRSETGGTLWDSVEHDFEKIVGSFHDLISKTSGSRKGNALCNVKRVRDLGDDLVLVPERYDPRRASLTKAGNGTRIGDVADVLGLMVNPKRRESSTQFLVLDTSDAREGVLVCRKTPVSEIGSTKKLVKPGCVLISRLRPYLRQVALADDEICGWNKDVQALCSSEFFALRSIDDDSISFLVPFLLSKPVQTVLAASQEGGHHPRFGQDTLLDLAIPEVLMERRQDDSARVEEAVAMFRRYERLTKGLVEDATDAFALTYAGGTDPPESPNVQQENAASHSATLPAR